MSNIMLEDFTKLFYSIIKMKVMSKFSLMNHHLNFLKKMYLD